MFYHSHPVPHVGFKLFSPATHLLVFPQSEPRIVG